MSADQLIDEALAAHRRALEARAALDDAATERDAVVRAALDAGAGAVPLAEALGVTRQRIYMMAKGTAGRGDG